MASNCPTCGQSMPEQPDPVASPASAAPSPVMQSPSPVPASSGPPETYRIENHRTGETVASGLTNLKRARNRVDKLDNDYGGYAHRVVSEQNGKVRSY